ncbi:tRNA (Ile)-lysidine synthase [Parasponia andersonii]|uniref:tRNA (Ile)-lysidine synthase n=1 Tax=Parasponia andersonii TaxID=3476 RepID=A0A2P5CJ04_PARAD|nr:tRNA (Ile)-lysidine synthase [Parasponia andersonii]
MVAISLYRGNLHRAPDVPRRWLMPTPQISLKDFRLLLSRRSRALSRLRFSTTTIATSSNPNPNPNPNLASEQQNGASKEAPDVSNHETRVNFEKVAADWGEGPSGDSKDGENPNLDGDSVKPVDGWGSVPDPKSNEPDKGCVPVEDGVKPQEVEVQKVDELANPNLETTKKEDLLNEKNKWKREVEEKLQVLNDKKHNLVQVLKQILSAEEELKRRISMQGTSARPAVPLQVDANNDSVSLNRLVASRMGSEPNLSGEAEGGETDVLSNHNYHSRQISRMNSTSPSSESPIRRPPFIQHNVAPHPTPRTSLGAAGSPSRITPLGQQGHSANLPTVSVSGTNYIASSPSPAASGGTSAFRDSRLPSPWN